jgi:hypothetical protein
MRRLGVWFVAVPVALVLTGCATTEEWATWKSHSTHFASGEHMKFSMQSGEKAATKVTRRDIALASDQAWWGRAITVEPGQILER